MRERDLFKLRYTSGYSGRRGFPGFPGGMGVPGSPCGPAVPFCPGFPGGPGVPFTPGVPGSSVVGGFTAFIGFINILGCTSLFRLKAYFRIIRSGGFCIRTFRSPWFYIQLPGTLFCTIFHTLLPFSIQAAPEKEVYSIPRTCARKPPARSPDQPYRAYSSSLRASSKRGRLPMYSAAQSTFPPAASLSFSSQRAPSSDRRR